MTLLDEFKAFVKAKPAGERYAAHDCEACALAQWGQEKWPGHVVHGGFWTVKIDGNTITIIDEDDPKRLKLMDAIVSAGTFGKLAAAIEAKEI